MKKDKPKMKLTIELGEDGVIRERIERSSNLTDEEEKRFWELTKDSEDGLLSNSELRKVFDEIFHF